MINLVSSGAREIYFIATYLQKFEAINLFSLIEKKYPKLKFKLIVINTKKLGNWKLNRIENLYIPHNKYWVYNSNEWKIILMNIFKNRKNIISHILNKSKTVSKQKYKIYKYMTYNYSLF